MTRHASPILALLACACALQPPVHERPVAAMPKQWDAAPAADAVPVTTGWWRHFGSTELDTLVRQAQASNHDLAAAVLRIEQARASATIAGAPRFPAVGAQAGASRSRQERDGSDATTDESSQAGLTVSYEVDLFGGNRAAARAALSRAEAARFDSEALRLVLEADVATTYFASLAFKDRLRIAHENRDAARKLLELVQIRFDAGAATALELAQQKTTLLRIEANVPSLEQSLRQSQNALAILLGRVPQGFSVAGESLAGSKPPAIDAGMPVALLQRRPDLRAAETQIEAAGADVVVARAALFPSLDLSASAALADWISGGSSTVASISASLVQNLFDAGARRARVNLNDAARKELIENYAQAILVSLQEVEDSMVAVRANERRSLLLTQAVEQARDAYRLALQRYESGATGLLELLDSQRQLLDAQDSLVQSVLAQHTAAVSLFKALGGGWNESPPAAANRVGPNAG